MSRDQTRNIETFKIGGSHLNQFEFHQHQNEMAERFRHGRSTDTDDRSLSTAEQLAMLTQRAKQKVRRRRKKSR